VVAVQSGAGQRHLHLIEHRPLPATVDFVTTRGTTLMVDLGLTASIDVEQNILLES